MQLSIDIALQTGADRLQVAPKANSPALALDVMDLQPAEPRPTPSSAKRIVTTKAL